MNLTKISILKGIVTFPAGFASEALTEIEMIIGSLYLPKKQSPFIKCEQNKIILSRVHLDTLFEILCRSSVITDIRVVVSQESVKSKSNLKTVCDSLTWDNYLNEKVPVRIKVDSVASEFYHESAMKEVIEAAFPLNFKIQKSNLNPKDNMNLETKTEHDFCNQVYFELYKNILTISISLSGFELYKRQYKKNLSASAPLREDIAQLCIKKSLQFLKLKSSHKDISCLFVPFGGSGTFVFEYYNEVLELRNSFFRDKYNFEETSIYKEKTVLFLKKKSLSESEKSELNLKKIIYLELEKNVSELFQENYNFFLEKVKNKSELLYIKIEKVGCETKTGNFLEYELKSEDIIENKVIFMPVNPPYGLRQHSKGNSLEFYKKVCLKINKLALEINKNKSILNGFILCPSEEIWALVVKQLKTEEKETFHFTQGGLHLRAVNFIY